MPKWSKYFNNLGTAGPPTIQAIKNLGFVRSSEIPPLFAKYLRVDAAQTFTDAERLQGRDNLALGTISTQDSDAVIITGGSISGIVPLAVAYGGTGASTPANARINIGLGNVNNTSDASKPISTATQAALAQKASLTGVETLTGKTLAAPVLNSPIINAPVGSFLRGHIYGLTISNNAIDAINDIDIAAGEAASTVTDPVLITLNAGLTKRLDAPWAVGSGNGGLDTGSVAVNTTYHVFLIQRSDTGVVDALFSASPTSPTMPANYDRKRRIGSIIREGTAIVRFNQNGDIFLRPESIDRNSTSATAPTAMAFSVPNGIVVRPIFVSKIIGNATANAAVAFGSYAWGSPAFFVQSCGANGTGRTTLDQFATNTTRQLYTQVVIAGGALIEYNVTTIGWIDDRGKLS